MVDTFVYTIYDATDPYFSRSIVVGLTLALLGLGFGLRVAADLYAFVHRLKFTVALVGVGVV